MSSHLESMSDHIENGEIQPKPRPVHFEDNSNYSGLTDHQIMSKQSRRNEEEHRISSCKQDVTAEMLGHWDISLIKVCCEIFYFPNIITYKLIFLVFVLYPPHIPGPLHPPSSRGQWTAWPACSVCWGKVLCHHRGTRVPGPATMLVTGDQLPKFRF